MDVIVNGIKIWRKLDKDELRKWSATEPNDSILRSPLENLLFLTIADVRNNPVVEKK